LWAKSRAATRADRVWVVDPVDGTTNLLLLGDSFVGVTVALLVDGRPVVGATGCPFTGELWSAAQGLGADDRSGRRLEVVERPPGTRRIALDPAVSGPDHLATWDAARLRLTEAFEEVEPRSAIALELAYVAVGIFDGLVQIGGSPVQDFAAGVLLIREAGGVGDRARRLRRRVAFRRRGRRNTPGLPRLARGAPRPR
jgi:myo-inositol-1(or 4)-monophosphatase